jgi:hypothetical protein
MLITESQTNVILTLLMADMVMVMMAEGMLFFLMLLHWVRVARGRGARRNKTDVVLARLVRMMMIQIKLVVAMLVQMRRQGQIWRWVQLWLLLLALLLLLVVGRV